MTGGGFAVMSSSVCRLLDPANTLQFDDFKKCYGEILYRWGLREKRADVLKFASCPPEPHKGIGTSQDRRARRLLPAAAVALTVTCRLCSLRRVRGVLLPLPQSGSWDAVRCL